MDLEFPDSMGAVIHYLNDAVGQPVKSQVRDPRDPTFVRVRPAGGTGIRDTVFEDVAYTIEAWDYDDQKARKIAYDCVHALKRANSMDGYPVNKFRLYSSPVRWDDDSTQWRWTFTFSIRFRSVK